MIQLAGKILMNPKYTIMFVTTFVYFTNIIIEIKTQSISNELIRINQRTNTKKLSKYIKSNNFCYYVVGRAITIREAIRKV